MNFWQYLYWLATRNTKGPAVPSSPTAQPRPNPTPGSVFDDFDGPAGTAPDGSLWSVVTGIHQGVSTGTADNVFLDGDSNLVIQAQNTSSGWTTGWLTSWYSRAYGYGKLSASIMMPSATGMDSAFWLLGPSYDPATDTGEPQCGEIDIIEYIGNGQYNITVHGPMYGGSPWNQAQVSGAMNFNPSQDFHTYWCDHEPGKVTFGVDATTTAVITPKQIPPGAPWVLDQPFNVLFCIVVGNGMSGQPSASTPSPSQMLVDWFYWEPS